MTGTPQTCVSVHTLSSCNSPHSSSLYLTPTPAWGTQPAYNTTHTFCIQVCTTHLGVRNITPACAPSSSCQYSQVVMHLQARYSAAPSLHTIIMPANHLRPLLQNRLQAAGNANFARTGSVLPFKHHRHPPLHIHIHKCVQIVPQNAKERRHSVQHFQQVCYLPPSQCRFRPVKDKLPT